MIARSFERVPQPVIGESPELDKASRVPSPTGRGRGWIASVLLLVTLLATAGALAAWKAGSIRAADAAAASQPEPMEAVIAAVATPREHRPTITSIGTVLALRSITLRNELAGTVARGRARARADRRGGHGARRARRLGRGGRAAGAGSAGRASRETLLERIQQAQRRAAPSPRSRSTARAPSATSRWRRSTRTQAIIDRKTIRAPFRARVGLADVHPGQYLDEGTALTTLQGVDEAAHVDFTVAQQVARRPARRATAVRGLRRRRRPRRSSATIVAIDARVDPATRNATVRARIDGRRARARAGRLGAGARSATGPTRTAVVVPVSALRKGPEGDHVFVIATGRGRQAARARARGRRAAPCSATRSLILDGLAAGEQVAASGSFKLREGVAASRSRAVERPRRRSAG